MKEGNRWASHWSAWQFDNCFVNGTSIVEHGNLGGGRKTRRRVKDLNMEIWREEVEEIACKSNGCSTYKELNSTTRKFTNVKHGGHCDRRLQRDWQGSGWYRITGEAGTKLIDSPVVMFAVLPHGSPFELRTFSMTKMTVVDYCGPEYLEFQ